MTPRLVFFGTPCFAVSVLRFLLNSGFEVCAVVTRIDKPRKRSKVPIPSPVKECALEAGIPVFQPVKCSSEDFAEILRSTNADLFVVVAYGEIIHQRILDIPKLGCINLHAGLLPAYRGAAPIQRSIMNGESLSGLTVISMDSGMDSGDILSQLTIPIEETMTAGDLSEALVKEGGPLIALTIEGLLSGHLKGTKQDANLVSFAPKILKEEAQIFWAGTSRVIYNKIRALLPNTPPWAKVLFKGEEQKLFFHQVGLDSTPYDYPPGTILMPSKYEMIIVCSEGGIRVLRVQLESKKILYISDFLNGIANISALELL